LNPCLPRFALCAALLASGGVAARSNLDFATLTGGSYPELVDFSAYTHDEGAGAPTNHFEGVLSLRFAGTLAHHTVHVEPAEASAQDVAHALTWPEDFNYEFEMHGINHDIAPEINTVFLVAPPEFQFISSSTIRELASYRSPAVAKYVTPCVATALLDAN